MFTTQPPITPFATIASSVIPTPSDEPRWQDQTKGQRDLVTQVIISATLGLSTFLIFCVCQFFYWEALLTV